MLRGLTRGLQLIADAFTLTRKHVLTIGAVLHPDVIKDFAAMYDVWIRELASVVANPMGLVFGSSDPFKGSRDALHALEAKYEGAQMTTQPIHPPAASIRSAPGGILSPGRAFETLRTDEPPTPAQEPASTQDEGPAGFGI